jgi:hypothetical protein
LISAVIEIGEAAGLFDNDGLERDANKADRFAFDAAFSNAFKRLTGEAPSQCRQRSFRCGSHSE